MLSVSLPFRALAEGSGLGSGAFLERLAAAGVGSVELRVVLPWEDAERVRAAAERIWAAGLLLSVHSAPRSAESAVRDVFDPLRELLKAERQENTILVLHPVNGPDIPAENRSMLRLLTEHARENAPGVRLALENNRRMPDRTLGDCAALVTELIRDADPEYAGICFDLGHYAWTSRVWETPDSPALPPEDFLRRVIHTHIHALAGAERDYTTHFPLQLGSLPLKHYLDALRGHGYAGALNLELEAERFAELLSGEEAILGSAALLRQAE